MVSAQMLSHAVPFALSTSLVSLQEWITVSTYIPGSQGSASNQ
jgi:hypothetical protein